MSSKTNETLFLGNIEVCIEVTSEGRVYPAIRITKDKLSEMFPINDLNRIEMEAQEYDEYVNGVLALREAWTRTNVPAGTYKMNIALNSDSLTKEDD